MSYDEEERAFQEERERLLSAYEREREDRDLFVAGLMLDWKFGYGDGRLVHWTSAELDELLLDFFPRKVSLADEDLPSVTPDVARFLAFLSGAKLLRGDPLTVLQGTVGELDASFRRVDADPGKEGMAKRLSSIMSSQGVDPRDPDALQRWIEDFNVLYRDERDRLLGRDDDHVPEPLPAIALPMDEALMQAARSSTTLDQLVALTRFADPRRKLTEWHPTLADRRALADSFWLEERGRHRPRHADADAQHRRAPAKAAGFVKVRHGWLSMTERGRTVGRKPHEDWWLAFRALMKDGSKPFFEMGPMWWFELLDDLLEALPRQLYRIDALDMAYVREAALELAEEQYILPDLGAYDPRVFRSPATSTEGWWTPWSTLARSALVTMDRSR